MTTISDQLNLALEHHRAGRLELAQRLYEEILDSNARHPDALHLLGLILYERGDLEAAINNLRQALELTPNSAVVVNNLGAVYEAAGRNAEAADCYQRALRLKPNNSSTLVNLGRTYQARGELNAALQAYERSIAIRPDHAGAHLAVGDVLRDMRRPGEAIESFRRALSHDATSAQAHLGIGMALRDLGRFDEAIQYFENALQVNPRFAGAMAFILQTQRDPVQSEEMALRLERLLHSQGDELNRAERVHCHFALGDHYDRCQRWDSAFSHYREANSLKQVQFDFARELTLMSALIDTCSPPMFERGELGHPSDIPVLIVGMPRSGTTLVEQILCSHPDVVGGGELPYLGVIVNTLQERLASRHGYPNCLWELYPEVAAELAEEYLSQLRQLSTDKRRVTDKMPSNFLHLGLVASLFPRARVIHCRREPLDLCLSCFVTDLKTSAYGYSSDLGSLGQYYRKYSELMEHWRTTLRLEMLDVDYERWHYPRPAATGLSFFQVRTRSRR